MANKILSILLQKGGFSFSVLKDKQWVHAEKGQVENSVEESYVDSLLEQMNQQLYLNQSYDEIKIAYLGSQFNIVPNEYFEKEIDLQKWLEFNTEVFENDQIKLTNLDAHQAKLIYAFPFEVQNALQTKFSDFQIQSASEIFINSFQIETESPQAFINIHLKQIEILVFKHKKLYFYNIFEVETKEDIIYYILNCFKQLELDANSIEVYYFGWTLEDAALKMLMNFVRHVMPGTSERTGLMHYSEIQNLS